MTLDANTFKVGDEVRLKDENLPAWAWRFKGLTGKVSYVEPLPAHRQYIMTEVVFYERHGGKYDPIPCYAFRLELAVQPYTVDQWSID